MHFVFFLGQLEVLNYFILDMAREAEEAGADCYIVDLAKPETYRSEAFARYIRQTGCVLFLMNQFSPMPAWERLGIPIINFCQDHPRSMREFLENAPPHMHILVLDKNHEAFIRRFFPSVKHIHFLPNGGTREEPVLPFAERDIDVLYCGNCQPMPNAVPGFPFLKENGLPFYETCRDYLVRHPESTIEDAIDAYFEEGHEPLPSEEDFRELVLQSALPIDLFTRRHFKLACVKALDDAGIPVHIYGTGWETEDVPFSANIKIHPRVDSAECNRLIGRTKINLNILPWLRDGSSERVFNAMLNGAVCETKKNKYLAERFTDGKELVFFDLSDTEGLAAKARRLLDHPEEAAEIAACGLETAKTHDTWPCRFREIINFAEGIS